MTSELLYVKIDENAIQAIDSDGKVYIFKFYKGRLVVVHPFNEEVITEKTTCVDLIAKTEFAYSKERPDEPNERRGSCTEVPDARSPNGGA